jgi:hypothetical protein
MSLVDIHRPIVSQGDLTWQYLPARPWVSKAQGLALIAGATTLFVIS